jgi:uroporphyrin-III C-methyltransferase
MGKVVIIGAGPGDPDLITIKAVKYLQSANVVLVDRLVSEEILNQYVSSSAIIISVGKECSKKVSTPQQAINDLIVHYAANHALVIRLKGGDVAFFSNVLDELQVLKENKIPFEIIPGITAASAASAYTGIPLTARNYASAVRFLTLHNANELSNNQFKELAATSDTLVWYMSSANLNQLVESLIAKGIDHSKWIAVIEQASTPLQRVFSAPILQFSEKFGHLSFLSPSLVIVGKVAELSTAFSWFKSSNSKNALYFPALSQTYNLNFSPSFLFDYVSNT